MYVQTDMTTPTNLDIGDGGKDKAGNDLIRFKLTPCDKLDFIVATSLSFAMKEHELRDVMRQLFPKKNK